MKNPCWMTIREKITPNLHVLVRARVTLPAGRWTLLLSAGDYYHAWLGGEWLGQGPAPGVPEAYWYQEYPVEGGREITLALHLYYQGLVNRVWNSGDGRFGVWAVLCREDGEAVREIRWRYTVCDAYSGGTVGYDTQFLEDFDSRRFPEGWEKPEFDDNHWHPMLPAPGLNYKMLPQPTAPLQHTKVEAVSRREVPGGVLLDFGRERVGTLFARALGHDGDMLTLRFGEELDEAGRVRFAMRCNCRYEERWTLREGESVLHPYDYKAFRYAEILGLEQSGVTLEDCRLQERHYPMPEDLCVFSCGRDELEDVFRICKNAVRCGSQESFLDCPSREKGQYLGDAIITARSQVWLTGKTDLLRKCIGDFIRSAKTDPGLLAVAPGSLRQEIADFSLLFPALPLTDYAFTGDREFLRSCYPAVAGMTDRFGQYARPDGLLENVSHAWNLVDWPEDARDGYDFPLTRPVVGEGCHNVVNALWFGALLMKERMERILGLPVSSRSQQVARAFHRTFFRPASGLFADSEESEHCSLHANGYAACFGLLGPDQVDVYEALLLTPGRHAGPFPQYFALRGLARLGRYGALYRLLTRTDEYGWRNMLREGATACFEAWGKDQKWNTSLCHPWASGFIPLLIEEIAGLHPDPSAPEGLRYEPHPPEEMGDFILHAPLRGRLLRVERHEGRLSLSQYPIPNFQ